MDDSKNHQDQIITTEEAEEAISLCDFPLNIDESEERKDFPRIQDRLSSSEPSDFFEFFSDLSSEMSNAEDIIFCGKLIPYKDQSFTSDHVQNSQSTEDKSFKSFHARRCESLSEIKRSNKTKARIMRNSRSLDYKKLRRNSCLVMKSDTSWEIQRSSSKSSVKSDVPGSRVSKPRWYVLMFSLVKFSAPEMDLQDIKNRQVRRNPVSMFPAVDQTGRKAPVRQNDRRNSWGHDLLRVLSCKDHASVAVTASNGFMPEV